MAESAASPATPVVVARGDPLTDPSPRSLETMFRESKQLEDKILLRFDSIQVKFNGYDEAVKLLQAFTNRQPTTEAVHGEVMALDRFVNTAVGNAEKLSCEKFKGVQDRFKELDLRYDQLDGSNKEAISAALRAAEKAVEKTELNFTKQIDSLSLINTSNRTALESNINDLKERVTIIEANRQGGQEGFKTMLSVVGAIVALATVGNIVLTILNR